MDKTEMLNELRELDNQFRQISLQHNEISDIITDGIVDIDKYLDQEYKVLWILKEPWEDLPDGVGGGSWSITRDLILDNDLDNKSLFAKIAYIQYSIENDFKRWNDIPYITDSDEVREAIRHIAYINISKIPGKSSTDMGVLKKLYERNRELLLRQIEVLNPDIIIGGYTLHFFIGELGLTDQINTFPYSQIVGDKLYIHAYHPQARIKQESYFDSIINEIKKFDQR